VKPEEILESLKFILPAYSGKLLDVPEEKFSEMPPDGKWSKKQELGHLLDSAHTNIRRLVVAQYEENPHLVYDQEFWVKAFGYQDQPVSQLISLWVLLNEQFCALLSNMPDEAWGRQCNTGKGKPELHSLQWLAEDYRKHMLHHLHHILEMDPVPYP